MSSVDLYSIVHFGDKSYFEELNKQLGDTRYDAVYFELITKRQNLRAGPTQHLNSLKTLVGPTGDAIKQGRALGLTPQMDELDMRIGWIADLTAEEVAQVVADEHGSGNFMEPQAVSSAWRSGVARSVLQAALVLLPCPELHLFFVGALHTGSQAQRLPIALFPLLRGDFRAARRLKFAQVICDSTAERANVQLSDPITLARNQRLLESISSGRKAFGHRNVAVVYGLWHCDNIGRLLENQLELWYDSSRWITAVEAQSAASAGWWSKVWARWCSSEKSEAFVGDEDFAQPIFVGSLVLSALVGIEYWAAVDWSHIITSSVVFFETTLRGGPLRSSYFLDLVGYGLRHGAVYLFLQRWLGRNVGAR